jgi:hypothetical protein
MADGMFRAAAIPAAISSLFPTQPPGWTRLEPQSVSGDPTPGLEARVHDPLWLLTRQWQLGEFEGEDAGSPVTVHVSLTTCPLASWQPGDPADGNPVQPWSPELLLEPSVGREPPSLSGPGLRRRAEGGAQLVAQLLEAGFDAHVVTAMLADCPLPPAAADPGFDRSQVPLAAVLHGRVPDGEQAAAKLAAAAPNLPAWFTGVADVATAQAVTRDWLDWYRGQVSPASDPKTQSWVDDRLEYRFSLELADGTVLTAPEFDGGRIDWFDFDHVPGAKLGAAGAAPATTNRELTMLPKPLRFPGMPAESYWQFEDSQADMGALEAQPHDLARLLLAEFALVYSSDWVVVPLDVPFGTFTRIGGVDFTTTFGDRLTVPAADDSARSGHFELFRIGPDLDGLLVPPAVVGMLEGRPVEEVLCLRDEVANLAWAIEKTVPGEVSGDPRSRSDEPRPAPPEPAPDAAADLWYLLETQVPANWIPLVPISSGFATIELRKGAMVVDEKPVLPAGVLLAPTPLTIRDEEIPREGRRVQRVPRLARRVDGTYERWIARRSTTGRGEGSSNLQFDSAFSVEGKPPE